MKRYALIVLALSLLSKSPAAGQEALALSEATGDTILSPALSTLLEQLENHQKSRQWVMITTSWGEKIVCQISSVKSGDEILITYPQGNQRYLHLSHIVSVKPILSPMLKLPFEARKKPRDHHFTVELGSGALTLSYAQKARGNLLFGAGAGVAWEENAHNFHKNIWNVLHGDIFARYQPSPFVHLDLGATLMGFSPHDDDDRRGGFFGGYVQVALGYRYIFFAPRVRFGRASDYRGSEFGVLASPLVFRFVLPW